MIAPQQDQKKARIKKKRNTDEDEDELLITLYEDELLMLAKVDQKLFPLKSNLSEMITNQPSKFRTKKYITWNM